MKREIIQSPDLSGSALDQLKQWLGITRPTEDDLLTGLLHAGLDACEAFTRQLPIEVAIEELVEISNQWRPLASRPIRAITAVELVDEGGARIALASSDYEIDILPQGVGTVRLTAARQGRYLAVRAVAGIAPDWASLPDSLRHGCVRLAAQLYRDRDRETDVTPAASIAALWRPWRALALT